MIRKRTHKDTVGSSTARMDPESFENKAMNKVKYERYFDSKKLSTIIETGDHEKIFKWIKKNKLGLHSLDKNSTSLDGLDRQTPRRTLIRQILEEVANGHLIVKQILNSYVVPTNPSLKPSSNDYSVDLDFDGITHSNENGSGEQESAITDLVRLVIEHKGNLWSRNFSQVMDFILPDRCFTLQQSIRPNQKFVNRIKGIRTF